MFPCSPTFTISLDLTWVSTGQNLFSEFPTKQDSNQSLQLQRLARKIEILLVASLDIILSKKRITKALDQSVWMLGMRRLVCTFVVPKPKDRFFFASRPT